MQNCRSLFSIQSDLMSDPGAIYGVSRAPDLRVPRRLPLGAHACPRSLWRPMGYRDNACEPILGTAAIHFASYKFEQRRQFGCAVGGRGLEDQTNAALCRAARWPIPSARARRWSRPLRRTLPANRRDRVASNLRLAVVGLWSVASHSVWAGREPIFLLRVWDSIRIRVIMEPTPR
jgi:hypothetical protein